MQYQAGYFLNSIFDLFLSRTAKDKAEKIVFQLGHFNLECSEDLSHVQVEYLSEIKTIQNLLHRGVPTLPSTFIEDLFCTAFGKTKRKVNDLNQISHAFADDLLADDLYKAIHIIDPRINLASQKEKLVEESKAKGAKGTRYDFKYSFFPEYLGPSFIQLIEENRTLKSMVLSSGYYQTQKLKKEFEAVLERTQDFALEMPYPNRGEKGMSIELDDAPTETKYDFETDQQIQKLCNKIGWAKPLNIEIGRNAEINSQLRPLIDFTYNEYFDTTAKNFRSPLYKTNDGLTALQYALTPIAIARIQQTILEFLLSGKLSLNDKTWQIGVVERDVPCAHLAFQDLRLHFENLFLIKGEKIIFPQIKLTIYYTEEFKKAQLNTIYPGELKPIEKLDENTEFDLLIDISVLARVGLFLPDIKYKAKQVATIRSVRSTSSSYSFLTDKSITYSDYFSPNFDEKVKEKAKEALKYFLRNIFRKDGFLPGQLELINNILQQKNTLGLLPPGGGKTIAFQLAALLQPGVSFIVCPNIFLINSKIKELHQFKLKNTVSLDGLNVSQEYEEEYKSKLEKSEAQFIFLLPEFMRRKELRDALVGMEFNKVFINYLMIDEVHCVSEWGHDFNPYYHKIAYLKDQLFKNSIRQHVSIVALTGTAGYSCISDIKREYQIVTDNVVSSNIKQSQISFKVIDTTSNRVQPENNLDQIKQLIGGRKQVHFLSSAKDILPSVSKEKNSLVICPESIGIIGVSDEKGDGLAERLNASLTNVKIGAFKGNPEKRQEKTSLPETLKSIKNSDEFIHNEMNVLVATSDYGIGSNKPDIRNILFLSPPSSFEGFIQVAYRTGLDGKKSSCAILVDKQEFSVPETSTVGQYLSENRITFDKYLAYEKVISKYKGKAKELAILDQLWNGFSLNPTSYMEIISTQIEDNFQIEAELMFQPSKNAKRIYINKGGKTYGFIDLSDLTISSDESAFGKPQSEEILNYTVSQIKKRTGDANNIQEVLSSPIKDSELKSIAKVLENTPIGTFYDINIPFVNDGLAKIFVILSKKVSSSFSKRKIKKAYYLSLSEQDFINRLELLNPLGKVGSYKDEIIKLYRNVWIREEVELAIYRLSNMGLIEDCQIDELKQQFIVKLRKKENRYFKEELFNLFDDYLMTEIAANEKNAIKSTDGINLYQILTAYVDLFYKYILPARFNSIETLYTVLSQIPDNKTSTEEISSSLKDLMDRYFSAKYANSYFSLIPGVKSLMGKQQDFAIINGYLSHLGPLRENWLQLRKSSEIVTKIKPDNFIPYLLDAYACLISGEQKEELIDAAFDEIARGFIKMRKPKEYDRDNYQTQIQAFLDILYKNRPDLKESYGPIIWLRMHSLWLKDYNKGFKEMMKPKTEIRN